MHGPCGHYNKEAFCMKNNMCSKNYPRNFNKFTYEDDNGYPTYRRRDDGQSIKIGSKTLDNRWIVPYNLYLATKYNAHINVEICSTVKAVKYLYKYVYKGHDKIVQSLTPENVKGKLDFLITKFLVKSGVLMVFNNGL